VRGPMHLPLCVEAAVNGARWTLLLLGSAHVTPQTPFHLDCIAGLDV
jgi:hypothetical protein